MADPVWSFVYATSQTPEGNGFTRILYGNPVVNPVTGGSPANRRVEINSDNGSCVFQTSQVPALDEVTGFTCECVLQSVGTGNAGFEITFLGRQILVMVFETRIFVSMPSDTGNEVTHDLPIGPNNVATRIRLTFAAGNVIIYRNAVEILNTPVPAHGYAFQRVLWWGEEGGLQTWRELKTYLGGAVAP